MTMIMQKNKIKKELEINLRIKRLRVMSIITGTGKELEQSVTKARDYVDNEATNSNERVYLLKLITITKMRHLNCNKLNHILNDEYNKERRCFIDKGIQIFNNYKNI